MQGITVTINVGGDKKGLLGKSLSEIRAAKPEIKKKKEKKKKKSDTSLLQKVLESTIPVKPKYEVDTI